MSVNLKLRRSPQSRILLLVLVLLAGSGQVALAGETLEVSIRGVSGDALSNTEASLGLVRRREDGNLDAVTIRALYEKADAEIRRALEPFGFYRPEISSELTPPGQAGSSWRASFTIDPRDPVPIAAVDLRLESAPGGDETLTDLIAGFPLQTGQVLDHRAYETAKAALLTDLRELGYLDADYAVHRVEVDLQKYAASIQLQLETGPRYVIGPIDFVDPPFATDYLEKYLVLQQGETFTRSRLAEQRRALGRSGHFQEVRIETGEPVHGEIPVAIGVTPYKANRYRGRVGWGTDTGFGLGLDWTRRYLGDRGHQFNIGGAVVEERNRLAGDARYTIPLNPLDRHSLEFALRHESKDLTYEDVDLDMGGETRIATNLGAVLWHLPRNTVGEFELERRASLAFVGESYDVFEVLFGHLSGRQQDAIIDNIGPEAYATLSPDFEAVVPSLRLSLSRADDELYIRRGDYYNVELLGTDEALGSNISFWQARFSSWNIWPLGDNNRLLVRTALGYSDADSSTVLGVNFNNMPEYYEFRAGGARSVRGYGFEELFSSDTITGGKHQAVASIEYEHQIIPDWSAAVFLDGGNAFNDWDDIGEKLGTGIGIRWRSPVGLARIDLGIPLDDAEDSFQIYITVGPEF